MRAFDARFTDSGNERKAIYRDDADRVRFRETVEEAVTRFGVMVHAHCLMPNHDHLLRQTPHVNLSATPGWLQTTYSIQFNRRHRHNGHLFVWHTLCIGDRLIRCLVK